MYSRQETAKIKKEFWTAFGLYMLPVLSAGGEKVNWINYRTGEKDIYFRMHALHHKASIGIEITHREPGLRQIYFEQFKEFKNILHQMLGEEWTWSLDFPDESGKTIARIFIEVDQISIMKKADWPGLISFFKHRIIALDQFWSQVKYGFETLR